MANLKNGFSNKIIIYKNPVAERIVMMFSAITLTFIPLICIIASLFNNDIELIKMIFLLIIMIFVSLVMYFSAFKTYICFDVENKKITISKGLKKEELSTYGLISVTVENDAKYPKLFSLNYNFIGYSRKDYGWSTGPSSRVLFGSIKTQRRRLEKFCEECNKYLNK